MPNRILIVDDEPNIIKLVAKRLALLGFNIVTAADGEEALQRARTEKPDLVLLDVMIPGLSGTEVCRRIKDDPALADIRVVLFSAKVQDEDRKAGKQAGADAYVTKPFDPHDLVETVRGLLNGGQTPAP